MNDFILKFIELEKNIIHKLGSKTSFYMVLGLISIIISGILFDGILIIISMMSILGFYLYINIKHKKLNDLDFLARKLQNNEFLFDPVNTEILNEELKGKLEELLNNIDYYELHSAFKNIAVHYCNFDLIKLLREKDLVKIELLEIINSDYIKDNVRIIELLIDRGANIEATNKEGETTLIIASKAGNKEIVELLLDRGANIEAKDKHGDSALITASVFDHKEIVELLLDRGANTEAKNNEGVTGLIKASRNGYTTIVEILLNSGAYIEEKDGNSATSLILASQNRYINTVELLIKKGANIEAVDKNGLTSLLKAIEKGHTNIVKLLIDSGANIEAKNEYGNTALISASLNGSYEIVELLLNRGANIEAKNENGYTALIAASLNGSYEIVELLLNRGANIEAKNENGYTALIAASVEGKKDIVKLLLDKGCKFPLDYLKNLDFIEEVTLKVFNLGVRTIYSAIKQNRMDIFEFLLNIGIKIDLASLQTFKKVTENIFGKEYSDLINLIKSEKSEKIIFLLDNSENFNIEELLIAASKFGNKEIVELLLDRGANIEANDKDGNIALIASSHHGNIEIVELLLDRGANIEAKSEYGNTALNITSLNGNKEIVELLLDRGANIEAKSEYGNTALIMALEYGQKEIVELLLDRGANIEAKSEYGSTALIITSLNGQKEIVELLLDRGANIEANNKYGNTALITASEYGQKEIVELLLDRGANIEVFDNNGNTSLLNASSEGHKEVVELLISRGANIEAFDNNGNTSLLNASSKGHKEVVELLISRGANIEAEDSEGNDILALSIKSSQKYVVEFLLNGHVHYNVYENKDLTADITTCLFDNQYINIFDSIRSSDIDAVKFFVKYGANLNTRNEYKNFIPLEYAACLGNTGIINFISKYTEDKTFCRPLNNIELGDYERISFHIENIDEDVKAENLGLKIEYTPSENKYIDWSGKLKVIQKELRTDRLQLFENFDKYGIYFFNNSNEANLVLKLKINNQNVTLVKSFEYHHSKILLFKPLLGVETEAWHREKKLIEDILKTPVNIDDYRPGHYLFNPDISSENLICIEENSTAALPKRLNIQGKFVSFYTKDKVNKYVFSNIDDEGYKEWNSKLLEIQEILGSNVEIESYDHSTKTLILSDAIHDVLADILKIKDDQGNIPKLLKHKIDGNNELFYYQYLYSIPLDNWKMNIAMNNLNVILNKPNHVFKISECMQNSNEFDQSLLESGVNTAILLQALTALPKYIAIESPNYLKKGKVFWGHAPGDKQYYTSIHDVVSTMIIGGTGSGKSTLMNGIILSLLYNIDEIGKLFLVDLKIGVEFGSYEELESEKVTVFSQGTKPSKLLNAVKEIDAQIKLRLKYQKETGVKKFNFEAIYFIIDEFAEIKAMDDRGDGNEIMARQEIKKLLSSIAKLGRSVNVKLIVQSQDPNDIGDLKDVLLSRILLKTPESSHKDSTLTKNGLENMNLLGIHHTSFDAGRLFFEDNNPQKGSICNELLYPLLVIDKNKEEGTHDGALFADENINKDYFLKFKDSVQSSKSQLNPKMEHLIPSLYEDFEYLRDTELLSKYKKMDDLATNEEVIHIEEKINPLDKMKIEDSEYSDKEKEIFNMFYDMSEKSR